MERSVHEKLNKIINGGSNHNRRGSSVDKAEVFNEREPHRANNSEIHKRIQSQQDPNRGVHHNGNDYYTESGGLKSKYSGYSQFGASSVSKYSKESNGFNKTMTKDGRIYNDGRVTYYSGRVHVTNKPQFGSTSSKIFNRSLRDRDTFVNVFPNYRIARDHKYSTMRKHYKYPSCSIEGGPPHLIDRAFTHKMDFMKKYTEEMLKVQSMKRQIK